MKKQDFEWSTFSLKLKSLYSKVGGYAPEYVLPQAQKMLDFIIFDWSEIT